jgi:HK97 gp10 family phage protein
MPVDDRDFRLALDAMVARVEAATVRMSALAAGIVQAAAQRNAPVVTGTLRRSITMDPEGDAVYRVGPTVIYGRRIELGFMNKRDSLGRLFHQQPHPYLRPAVESSRGPIMNMALREFARAVRG